MDTKALCGCVLLGVSVTWGLCVLDGSAVGLLIGIATEPAALGNALLGILGAAATLLITLGYIDDRDGKIVAVKSQNATCKSGMI